VRGFEQEFPLQAVTTTQVHDETTFTMNNPATNGPTTFTWAGRMPARDVAAAVVADAIAEVNEQAEEIGEGQEELEDGEP